MDRGQRGLPCHQHELAVFLHHHIGSAEQQIVAVAGDYVCHRFHAAWHHDHTHAFETAGGGSRSDIAVGMADGCQ